MHLFSVGLDVIKARETALYHAGVRHVTPKRSIFAKNFLNPKTFSCTRLVCGAINKAKKVLCVLPVLFTGDGIANVRLLR